MTTTRSLTRRGSRLAHHLALGMALLERAEVVRYALGARGHQQAQRGRLVLEEAFRLRGDYSATSALGLADHVTSYALPDEYTFVPGIDGRSHDPSCPAVDGYDSCGCSAGRPVPRTFYDVQLPEGVPGPLLAALSEMYP